MICSPNSLGLLPDDILGHLELLHCILDVVDGLFVQQEITLQRLQLFLQTLHLHLKAEIIPLFISLANDEQVTIFALSYDIKLMFLSSFVFWMAMSVYNIE